MDCCFILSDTISVDTKEMLYGLLFHHIWYNFRCSDENKLQGDLHLPHLYVLLIFTVNPLAAEK